MNVHIGGKKYFFRPAQARAKDMTVALTTAKDILLGKASPARR